MKTETEVANKTTFTAVKDTVMETLDSLFPAAKQEKAGNGTNPSLPFGDTKGKSATKGRSIKVLSARTAEEKAAERADKIFNALTPLELQQMTNFSITRNGSINATMIVTPKLAKEWLNRNVNVRKPIGSRIARYADDMQKGDWDSNGVAMVLDENGNLVDGQNRSYGCIKADTEFETSVYFGGNPRNIDRGKNRSDADILSGEDVPHSNIIATTINLYNKYKNGGNFLGQGHGKFSLSVQEMTEMGKNHLVLNHSVDFTRKSKTLFGRWGVHATLMCIFAESSTMDKAEEFYTNLMNGTGLEADDPVFHLRERLKDLKKGSKTNGTVKVHVYAGNIIKGWNYFINNQSIKRFGYSYESEGVPKIKGARTVK